MYRVLKGYNGPNLATVRDSHIHNPTGTPHLVPAGKVLRFERDDGMSGSVWFYDGDIRCKSESGSLENMLRRGILRQVTLTELGQIILANYPAEQVAKGYNVDPTDLEEVGRQALAWGDIGRDGELN